MVRAALVAALAALVCTACGGASNSTALLGTKLHKPAADFALHDDRGHVVSLKAQRGHYVFVTFLYTKCPDVCPLIAGRLNETLKTATAKHAGVRVLAVSVDPVNDTAPAVARYGKRHGLVPAFHYLIGSRAELQPVWKAYGIASAPGPSGTTLHSAFEFLIDPAGREVAVYDKNAPASTFEHDIAALTGSTA